MKTKYVENRERVIADIMNAVKIQYPKDMEIVSGAIDLTVQLTVAPENEQSKEFVNDLRGFLMYADMTQQPRSRVCTTLLHDLSEFARNRKESWFCPRTTGYSKYLSGASNLQVI